MPKPASSQPMPFDPDGSGRRPGVHGTAVHLGANPGAEPAPKGGGQPPSAGIGQLMTATCALASRLQTARFRLRAPPRLRGRRGAGHLQPSPGTDRAGPYDPLRPDGLRTSACRCLLTPGGHRLGRRLFDAASLHARNRGIDTLIIQALAINQPMLQHCTRRRATIEYFGADAEARVRLPADNVSSHIAQLVEQNLAEWDFADEAAGRLLEDWVEGWRLGP